jgi:hypothetical protein
MVFMAVSLLITFKCAFIGTVVLLNSSMPEVNNNAKDFSDTFLTLLKESLIPKNKPQKNQKL